ncbi:hypothetical protein Pmani_037022 [Petrolisthes manimaculis]|uniref:Uncharacterized protein n=1 Tax=Petrolisthes manimaculis TaxID=1843537 RepID=A0AAE1NH57_9EUCA|nr:hypothetical protein Pmani_037022 [Petrolisthes manimaculis]
MNPNKKFHTGRTSPSRIKRSPEHASAPGRGRNDGASSTCAEGTNNPPTNSTLDSPPDQENTDPVPQKQRHGAQRNVRNYKTVKWSHEEKKKILHCFT